MAKKVIYSDELEQLKSYLKSSSNEDAKRPLLYPLFKKLFAEKFKIESDAKGADGYVEGKLIIEAKTSHDQWLEGFYQALHYHKKYGLTYNTIMVIANSFVGIWKLNKLPEYSVILSKTADAQKAPNVIGKENAKKTQKAPKNEIKKAAFYWLDPKDLEGDIFGGARNLTTESYEILNILKNLDSDRIQVNTHNFIGAIERLKPFFEHSIDAVHAFYTIVAYWDITSTCSINEQGNEVRIIGFHGSRFSDPISIRGRDYLDFKKYVETQYIFTNEGSGLTVDYYFSRFDEVLARIDPVYVKQHGIFFTDGNLSKFALWFAKNHFPGNINDDYIVFDPAGGSGNLVSSWRGKLKHKIISELQPDLLRTVERRMKADPFHIESGFTVIPKSSENIGLNFINLEAEGYLEYIIKGLKEKNQKLDKSIAFLLNPPYKNTDENQKVRKGVDAHYEIHPSILELTGDDAGKERYLAFLGQILNISKIQYKNGLKPVVMIFTPTSWLIPRPNYFIFRKNWDAHFRFHSGFLVSSNEFFKLEGKWPLAFTIWQYDENEERTNTVKVSDYTYLNKISLNLNWNDEEKELDNKLALLSKNVKYIALNSSKGRIKDNINQFQYAFKRDPNQAEIKSNSLIGGLPRSDSRRNNKKTYGITISEFVGLMDDNTPVRVQQDTTNRLSNKPNRLWLQLRPTFIDINLTKVQSCPQDKYGYCAYDLSSAQATFSWFGISKAVNGKYPLWANQYDIWPINFAIAPKKEKEWYAFCFAYILAENRCVVTKFEKDNPVVGAPEVFIDNPLCPTNEESFWSTTLDNEVKPNHEFAYDLVQKVKELYKTWNINYCKGQYLTYVGLQDEPYFKYFDYPDFLTPHSGLIQIRKYAERQGLEDILKLFAQVQVLTKKVKEEMYRILIEDFKYFE